MNEESSEAFWMELGEATFVCATDAQILAVLYWSHASTGEHDEPGGEPEKIAAGWSLILDSDPRSHLWLEISDRRDVESALETATAVIEQHHGGPAEQ